MTTWVTVDVAAGRLSYSRNHIRDLARLGKVRAAKDGSRTLVDLDSLRQYFAVKDGFISSRAAARKYGYSLHYIRHLAQAGQVESYHRSARRLYVRAVSMEEYLRRPRRVCPRRAPKQERVKAFLQANWEELKFLTWPETLDRLAAEDIQISRNTLQICLKLLGLRRKPNLGITGKVRTFLRRYSWLLFERPSVARRLFEQETGITINTHTFDAIWRQARRLAEKAEAQSEMDCAPTDIQGGTSNE